MLEKLSAAVALLHSFLQRQFSRTPLAGMFDSYHPERHYMRGYGPKSRVTASQHDAGSEHA
jgi:hypothetical protein